MRRINIPEASALPSPHILNVDPSLTLSLELDPHRINHSSDEPLALILPDMIPRRKARHRPKQQCEPDHRRAAALGEHHALEPLPARAPASLDIGDAAVHPVERAVGRRERGPARHGVARVQVYGETAAPLLRHISFARAPSILRTAQTLPVPGSKENHIHGPPRNSPRSATSSAWNPARTASRSPGSRARTHGDPRPGDSETRDRRSK
ncbi:unnamed protein product [Mycena citricolor]|uniref:Uncharacterized protein n=1 Tax=Mycena citricolor TaxID=2018698 RepID=A0AAD2GVS6_9AGAR|nr:unnamed protein product [Mycena citricolor]